MLVDGANRDAQGGRDLLLAEAFISEQAGDLELARGQGANFAGTHRDPLAGRLRVAFLPTIGPYLLPQIMPRLRKALPRLDLMLYEFQTATMLERLHAGEIDLGILALPVDLDGLESRHLFDEPFVVALPQGHELAKQPQVRTADLSGETLLLLEDGHCRRDQALEVCARVDVHESSDYRATSLETLRQMVAAGHGITLLPEMALHGPYDDGRSLTVRPFAKPVPKRQIGAVWRRSSTRVQAIQAVCDTIANAPRR